MLSNGTMTVVILLGGGMWGETPVPAQATTEPDANARLETVLQGMETAGRDLKDLQAGLRYQEMQLIKEDEADFSASSYLSLLLF